MLYISVILSSHFFGVAEFNISIFPPSCCPALPVYDHPPYRPLHKDHTPSQSIATTLTFLIIKHKTNVFLDIQCACANRFFDIRVLPRTSGSKTRHITRLISGIKDPLVGTSGTSTREVPVSNPRDPTPLLTSGRS